MTTFEVCYEGWDGDPTIGMIAEQQTQQLVERGATIEKLTLIIKAAEFFTGFYFLYEPGEFVKSYLLKFNYRNYPICVNTDGVDSRWNNSIRIGVNEALRRIDNIDINIRQQQ